MEDLLKQSTAANVTVTMIDAADHIAGKTGLAGSLVIYAMKDGGAPAAITPAVTELDSVNAPGVYKLALTVSHTDTLGELALHITAAGADPSDLKWQIATDPWSVPLPGAYPDHSAGQILSRIDLNPPTSPVIVIPGAPADVSLCRVYGYLETLDNKPAVNVEITFVLQAPDPTKSNRLISGRAITVHTDDQGRIVDADGNPYVDLQRNDNLTPTGTTYKVLCKALQLNTSITLAADLFDLASVVP